MKIQLNGEPRLLSQARTIGELLEEIACPPQTVIVEHNGQALRRTEWAQAQLREDDRVEIVRIVAGG